MLATKLRTTHNYLGPFTKDWGNQNAHSKPLAQFIFFKKLISSKKRKEKENPDCFSTAAWELIQLCVTEALNFSQPCSVMHLPQTIRGCSSFAGLGVETAGWQHLSHKLPSHDQISDFHELFRRESLFTRSKSTFSHGVMFNSCRIHIGDGAADIWIYRFWIFVHCQDASLVLVTEWCWLLAFNQDI